MLTQEQFQRAIELNGIVEASPLKFWISKTKRNAAAEEVQNIMESASEPERAIIRFRSIRKKGKATVEELRSIAASASDSKETLNMLEGEALRTGWKDLWEAVLLFQTKHKEPRLYFYARGLVCNNEEIRDSAAQHLYKAIEDKMKRSPSEEAAGLAEHAPYILGALEASLKRGGGYWVVKAVQDLANNTHQPLDFQDAKQIAETAVEAGLSMKEGLGVILASKPEGPLCLGAQPILENIVEGRYGKWPKYYSRPDIGPGGALVSTKLTVGAWEKAAEDLLNKRRT
jgi:hypothetical protein